MHTLLTHDDVIKCEHFQRYWPFVWGIHRPPVNSPHKDQWRGALMFFMICALINCWANNREAPSRPLWRTVMRKAMHVSPKFFLLEMFLHRLHERHDVIQNGGWDLASSCVTWCVNKIRVDVTGISYHDNFHNLQLTLVTRDRCFGTCTFHSIYWKRAETELFRFN